MKKTNMIIKDTFREIKQTKGRFFSIFAIVMIGVSFFAGIMSSGPTMRKSADHYFDEYNLMDYRILSNFGLTTDDINAIRNIDGVESVSPGYEKDVLVTVNNKETVLRVHSLDMTHSQNNDNNYINRNFSLNMLLPVDSKKNIFDSYFKKLIYLLRISLLPDNISLETYDATDTHIE